MLKGSKASKDPRRRPRLPAKEYERHMLLFKTKSSCVKAKSTKGTKGTQGPVPHSVKCPHLAPDYWDTYTYDCCWSCYDYPVCEKCRVVLHFSSGLLASESRKVCGMSMMRVLLQPYVRKKLTNACYGLTEQQITTLQHTYEKEIKYARQHGVNIQTLRGKSVIVA